MSTVQQPPYTLGPWLTSLMGDHTGHPDTKLLALVGEWVKNEVEHDLIGARYCSVALGRMPAVVRQREDLLRRRDRALRDRIARIRPQTEDGFKAKALVALSEAGGGVFRKWAEAPDLKVAWALARAILGEAAYREALAWEAAVNRDYDAHAA